LHIERVSFPCSLFGFPARQSNDPRLPVYTHNHSDSFFHVMLMHGAC